MKQTWWNKTIFEAKQLSEASLSLLLLRSHEGRSRFGFETTPRLYSTRSTSLRWKLLELIYSRQFHQIFLVFTNHRTFQDRLTLGPRAKLCIFKILWIVWSADLELKNDFPTDLWKGLHIWIVLCLSMIGFYDNSNKLRILIF